MTEMRSPPLPTPIYSVCGHTIDIDALIARAVATATAVADASAAPVVTTISTNTTLARARDQVVYIGNGGWTVTTPLLASLVDGDSITLKSADNNSAVTANIGQMIDKAAAGVPIAVLEGTGVIMRWYAALDLWIIVGSYAP